MVLNKLKSIRTNRNMTYKEVAEKIGVTKEYYWMIENGKRRLTYEMAVKIANVFGTNPDNIFLQDGLTTSEQKGKEVS